MDVSKRVIVLLTVVFVNICFFNYVHGSATNNGTQGEGVPPMPISTKGNKYRAIFVFGDSLVDAGNNNYLNISLAKAFNRPNGIDFPSPNASNPTGRFTNGLTIVDMIGKSYLIPLRIPSYCIHLLHELVLNIKDIHIMFYFYSIPLISRLLVQCSLIVNNPCLNHSPFSLSGLD